MAKRNGTLVCVRICFFWEVAQVPLPDELRDIPKAEIATGGLKIPQTRGGKKQTLGWCLGNLNVSPTSDVRMEPKQTINSEGLTSYIGNQAESNASLETRAHRKKLCVLCGANWNRNQDSPLDAMVKKQDTQELQGSGVQVFSVGHL